jgi:hypothetical protein
VPSLRWGLTFYRLQASYAVRLRGQSAMLRVRNNYFEGRSQLTIQQPNQNRQLVMLYLISFTLVFSVLSLFYYRLRAEKSQRLIQHIRKRERMFTSPPKHKTIYSFIQREDKHDKLKNSTVFVPVGRASEDDPSRPLLNLTCSFIS